MRALAKPQQREKEVVEEGVNFDLERAVKTPGLCSKGSRGPFFLGGYLPFSYIFIRTGLRFHPDIHARNVSLVHHSV